MTSLTTADGDFSSTSSLILTSDAMSSYSDGKVNSVVSELARNWRKLNSSECNVKLFTSLLNKNISTRDIYFFIKKQADLRKVNKGLDRPLSRKAMRSKLNDACAFSVRQRRLVNQLKKKLLLATGNMRFKHRRIIKELRVKLDKEKRLQIQKDELKIKRYVELQAELEKDVQAKKLRLPASLTDYSDLKAFNTDVSKPPEMEPPVVYDPSIDLSPDELSVLAKGPKFAVRQKLVEENFRVELEKMVCKEKYQNSDVLDDSQVGLVAVNEDASVIARTA